MEYETEATIIGSLGMSDSMYDKEYIDSIIITTIRNNREVKKDNNQKEEKDMSK